MFKIKGRFKEAKIEAVEVLRQTEHSVFLSTIRLGLTEMREAKRSEWVEYYATWEEARAALEADAEQRLAGARRSLQLAQSHQGNVKGMRKPGEPA